MAEAFHLEQFAVDAVPQVAQVREVVNPLPHVKVFGVVDRGLRAEGRWAQDVVPPSLRAVGLTALALDVFGRQAAAQAIQGKYFDGHPILACDIEAELEQTIQTILGAVATFKNEL